MIFLLETRPLILFVNILVLEIKILINFDKNKIFFSAVLRLTEFFI